jgi:hypothetical protein
MLTPAAFLLIILFLAAPRVLPILEAFTSDPNVVLITHALRDWNSPEDEHMETLMHHRSQSVARLVVALLFFAPSPVCAQEGGETTFGGGIDAYYAYSFQSDPLRTRAYTTQPLRNNEFNLNLGFIEVKHQAETARGRLALQTGTYVESNLAAEPDLLKLILEASVGTRVGTSTWVDVGIFPSHIGFEGIVSKDNWTYSRSLLADYSPYYEAGLSVTAAVSDAVTLRGLILNGWQNIAETNDDKAIGTQVQYRPSEQVLLNWSTFIGNEKPDSLPSQLRIFNDVYGVITLSDRWSAALVFDVGAQKQSGGTAYDLWHAGAVMVRRVLDDQWAIAARVEYFSDGQGVIVPTGTPNNFKTFGGSINLDYAPVGYMVWRIEARTLLSKDAVYPTQAGFQNTDGFVVLSAAMSL